MAGMAVGSMIPVVGTAIGGVVGGLIGGIFGPSDKSDKSIRIIMSNIASDSRMSRDMISSHSDYHSCN
jgi:uncharacterized protein YcfJ